MRDAGRILVVGATGTVGRELVKALRQRGEAVREATRAPRPDNADAVRFDLERPETFAPALHGVDRVFLIARPGDEQADRFACPLIDEMARRGVRRVVNLTAMGTEHLPEAALYKVEVHLEASGMAFTHLRPNWFMQVFAGGPLLASIRGMGAVAMPTADARVSYIDVRDIAAVAAAALCDAGHAGAAYTLTGDEALDTGEAAAHIGRAVGRRVVHVDLTEAQARGAMAGAGLPPERVERLIGFYRLVREGWCAPVSTAVRDVLGRLATPFSDFARDYASVWR